jgi:hypothetical protein
VKRNLAVSILLSSFAAGACAAPGFVVTPAGQATGSTCQSYALGIALAFKRDASFKIDSASDLRKVELAIRSEIKKAAGTNPVSHDHIVKGFSAYTGGKYKLQFRDVDLAGVGDIVAARTGIANANAAPPNFLLGDAVKDVVLASATKIDSDAYGSGHIFSMFGVDGPPNSNQKFLVLNSAVKVKNTSQNACVGGIPDDPGSYTAGLSWKSANAIEFKALAPGKIRLWNVDKG